MFDKLHKNISEALDFPTDVLGDRPKVTMIGRQEITIENFGEIITFTEEEVCLNTREGFLTFKGKGFVLKTILPTELRIDGELESLSYGGRGNS